MDRYVLRIDLANKSGQVIDAAGRAVAIFGPDVTRGSALRTIAPHGWSLPPDPEWTQVDPPECPVFWVGNDEKERPS
ncbi:hypothetical protein [Nocardia sp. NRRL S-836]|uniref:hypothetical protein n=1 Tax=Nocardia sp. NRRL S-836 TaxID=1519492 RepID=UPI0006AE2FAD|nr:hypothetical protein [Nocardia sp. NRRL S-836]KOV77446.1 hypothetical protein ADL03_41700 [Nocardia sp. NRRL S-836]